MVQGVFDDLNPDTVSLWAYPDTGRWDAERNTREFLAAMPEWRRHGLLSFTINLQGGSPQGYSRGQPWHNSAFEADGALRADYAERMARILDRADELGMAVILGYFYFGQDQRLRDEAAVLRASDLATPVGARSRLAQCAGGSEQRDRRFVRSRPPAARAHPRTDRTGQGRPARRSAGCSWEPPTAAGAFPAKPWCGHPISCCSTATRVQAANLARMAQRTRAVPGYTPKPIVFNEDDHFDFDRPENNFTAAVGEHASWGYFDYRMKDEGFDEGYQSVPRELGHLERAQAWLLQAARGNLRRRYEVSGGFGPTRPGAAPQAHAEHARALFDSARAPRNVGRRAGANHAARPQGRPPSGGGRGPPPRAPAHPSPCITQDHMRY